LAVLGNPIVDQPLSPPGQRAVEHCPWQPVRNRDLWDVLSTHPDGSLTVSHRAGHGIASLPPAYTHDHERLGYAATEHGNQADTVDVAIELVSTATTHRGLYVGATRGRDDNRLHVITESGDLGEARDVLDGVLAHDRADIPAVTQRRDLGRQAQPAQTGRPESPSIIPDWVGPWRTGLERRRDDLAADLADRAARRSDAAVELADLQPALAAARAAWQPYSTTITEIEDELGSQLRPAMWKANHDAMYAGFGHHHTTARRAGEATSRVNEAEHRIAAIRADGADIKLRHDVLQAGARTWPTSPTPRPADTASKTSPAESSTTSTPSCTRSTSGPRGHVDFGSLGPSWWRRSRH
jgi:hypothetical protein